VCRKYILHNRLNLTQDTLTFVFDEVQLIVVRLELLFLKEDDLGAFWNTTDSFSIKALRFSNQFLDVLFEVNLKLLHVVIFFTEKKRSLKTCLGSLDVVAPALSEVEFINDQILSDQVELIHVLFHVLVVDHVAWELLDRTIQLGEEVPDPDNFSSIWRHVSDDWRAQSVLIEALDNPLDFRSIVLQDRLVFAFQFVLDRVRGEYRLQLLEQLETVTDDLKLREVLLDESLEIIIKFLDFLHQVYEVLIKIHLLCIQDVVCFSFEGVDLVVEFFCELIHSLKVVVPLKGLELLDHDEDVDKFADSSDELFEATENHVVIKIPVS